MPPGPRWTSSATSRWTPTRSWSSDAAATGNRPMTTPSTHPALVGRPVYLDYNATTPIDPAVVDAMTPYLTREFGNPSSSHVYGAAAHAALEQARGQVAELIRADTDAIVFTGSG